MEHGRFLIKGLIMPCMFTFCVEVELAKLMFNIEVSLVSLYKINITELFGCQPFI